MDAERFQRAADLFLRARALGLSERDEFLAAECGDDGELRASVVALIAGAERSLPFADLAAELGGALAPLGADAPPPPDSRIGNYRLLEKLGEGGFGTVYMAEQVEPVRRKVALKILRPGLDTRQVIARFEAERQALALMDHPNITRVLDAGATQHGRPYFVMELIRGLPITQFCDQNQLDARERLELMLPVCQAVQHAHQKGIIHRDLKPSNVLVTVQDGVPVPKVIDFGIVKALHAPLTDRTLFTEFRQVMGTPEYMSPEQAETTAVDVDTRADVFSLGVMLYELLTGTTPLDGKTLREAPYGEMQRLIREVEPPTPSRRLVTIAAPDERGAAASAARAREIARARGSDPQALRRQLSGEIDWIVMKCLEKDRRRRYETASALAADLGNYLANEPVMAGPPSTLYRLKKLAQRHRALFGGAVVLLVAIAVALAGVTYGLLRAIDERDSARAAHQAAMQHSREVQALSDVLREMLRVAGPRGLRDDSYTVQQMLTDFERDLGTRLADQPEQEVMMRPVLGEVLEMADRNDAFVDQIERAVDRARRSLEPSNAMLPMAMDYLAYARNKSGLPVEALQVADEAHALRHGDGTQLGLIQRAIAHSQLGQHRAALADAEAALTVALRATGEQSAEYANVLAVYGGLLSSAGRPDLGEPQIARAIERRRAALGPTHVGTVLATAEHALARLWLGDIDGAHAEMEAVAASLPKQGAWIANAKVAVAVGVAACLAARGRFEDAVARAWPVLGPDATQLGVDSRGVKSRLDFVEILLDAGRVDAAADMLAHIESPQSSFGETPIGLRRRMLLGVCHHRRGDLTLANRELDDALTGTSRYAEPDSPLVARVAEHLAELLLDLGRPERAAELAAVALRAREQAPFPRWRVPFARALLAAAELDRRPAAAAQFDAAWRELRDEPALPPDRRARLAAVAERRAGATSPTSAARSGH